MTVLVEETGRPAVERAPSRGRRLTVLVDLAALSALALFAAWSLLYLVALTGVLPSTVAFWTWVLTAPLVVLSVVRWLRAVLDGIPPRAPWVPLAVAGGFALLAALIVRPDLDDASYVVRSTWIAANGDVRVGDVIFSDGAWPGMAAQTPYLPSVEALFGWLARVSGLSAGTVVYVLVPPLAAFGAVWALWMLLRAWRARSAALCLVLAAVFLLWGGATHGSWGNLHLARIWQGKIIFVAVLVPLLYAVAAALWSAERAAARRAALVLVGLSSVAGVGLTPAAVFVVPGIVLVAAVPGILRRRWAEAALLVAVGALPALAGGVAVLLAGETAAAVRDAGSTGEDPWLKVLGYGVPAAVVLVAGVVAVLGLLWPRSWGSCGPVGGVTAGAALVAGSLVAVDPLYRLAADVMGGDPIAWRLTWVVPVPALVGLLAGVPWLSRLRLRLPVVAVTAVALVWGGLPLWSAANGAWLATPGAWEQAPHDLAAARWLADQEAGGRVLAPTVVSAAGGVVTADLAPVGSRSTYLAAYEDLPGARIEERTLLQRLADGAGTPEDRERASAALAALDVRVACAAAENRDLQVLLTGLGWAQGFDNGFYRCFTAPPGS